MNDPVYTDPATGREYTIGPDGKSRWVETGPRAAAAFPEPAGPGHGRTPAKKSGGTGRLLVGGVIGVIVGFIGGAAAGGAGGDSGATAAVAAPTVTVTETGKAPAGETSKAPAKTSKAPAPKATIDEGSWLVPDDIPAGRYRMDAPPENGDCYWAIYKAGTNQDDIIANDIVTGGRATVTLKKGQEFATQDCGTWTKA